MADELDLEQGDPAAAEAASARSQRRQRRKETSDAPSKRDRTDDELSTSLDWTLDQIVEWREAREDEELAVVIAEDKKRLSKGVISVTRRVPFLRGPLFIALTVLEPVLAFSRVGRILIRRGLERRERRMAEREAEQQQAEYAIPDAEVVK